MPLSYADQTMHSSNPFARYAHRRRFRTALALALPRIGSGKVLDYGCGSGAFISELLALGKNVVGYEPFMEERVAPNLPIYSRMKEVESLGPYGMITLFETVEHLKDSEIDGFLATCRQLLSTAGIILISAPIEIGPAVILKEFNRYLRMPRHNRHFGYSATELLKASVFGIPAKRDTVITASHKGFDFRRVIRRFVSLGWQVEILAFSPLPIGTWYGNSQVFLSVKP